MDMSESLEESLGDLFLFEIDLDSIFQNIKKCRNNNENKVTNIAEPARNRSDIGEE